MTSSNESARPDYATEMVGAQELHGEILDPSTRNVWQSLEPMTREEYKAHAIDDGWIRAGIGAGVMDEHWFDRSPGSNGDGAMDVRQIGGRRFGLCARPLSGPELPTGPDGPRKLLIDKFHGLRFAEGRSIQIMVLPDGSEFVHVVEGGAQKSPLALPVDWTIRTVELESDWILRLPAPTTVFFFPNGDSYQGPVTDAPEAEAANA
jgi:hypothetical protein